MRNSPDVLSHRLLAWFDRHRRDLPWRAAAAGTADPYHVLVSEAMLQQTQVATVIPYFQRFIQTFPTLEALANADEQRVLRLWQGLGYYSRARNLRRAAQRIVESHGGQIPRTVDALLALPGVGRYTAGAVASIAYDVRAPILDGNVTRVLCRLDAINADPRDRAIQKRLWERAEQILPHRRTGDFNQALMELGATVCTPKRPACLLCPLRESCAACRQNAQDRIPPARVTRAVPMTHRWVLCVRQGQRYLIEQRPPSGRWAGLWQFVTVPAAQEAPDVETFRAITGCSVGPVRFVATVHHALTHRKYRFDAFVASTARRITPTAPRRWATAAQMGELPFSKPQLAIREHLMTTILKRTTAA